MHGSEILSWSFPEDTQTAHGYGSRNGFLEATVAMQAVATIVASVHPRLRIRGEPWVAGAMGSFTLFHICHVMAHYTNSDFWYLPVHYTFVTGSMCLANGAPRKSPLSKHVTLKLLIADGVVHYIGGNFCGIVSGLLLCLWAVSKWATNKLLWIFALSACSVLTSLLICDVKTQCTHDITETIAFCASTLCTFAFLATASGLRDRTE